MPAVMPAFSWSPASEGPIVWMVVFDLSKLIGRAPYFRLVARLLASDSLKLPVICEVPSEMTDSKKGAEITWPSRTIANVFDWSPAIACESLRWMSAPWLFIWSPTVHWTWPCDEPGAFAEAEVMSVPSICAGESRYFWPWSSHVTIGMLGSPTTGFAGAPGGGQV